MNKKKVLVIVPEESNRMELLLSLRRLAEADIAYTLISPVARFRIEKESNLFLADSTLDDFSGGKFDALILISGHPNYTKSMFEHGTTKDLVKEYNEQGKTVATICSSVICLQDICEGKRLAAFQLDDIVNLMKSKGAILTGATLEVDGNIVTAANEMATDIWIEKIIEQLMA